MKSIKTSYKTWVAGTAMLLLAVPMLLSLHGCTDLDEEVFDAVTAENFYRTEDEVIAALAPVYANLRDGTGDYHNLSQVSSDETIVPTRGSDWFDGGTWLDMHRHTWDPNLGALNGAWENAYRGVARANVVLETLQDSEVPNKDQIVAELRALRAFYYYQLMDLFGGVPIVGDDEFTIDPKNLPSRESRAAVFDFVESELNAARESLPEKWDASGYGRLTKGSVDAILASMYLNAEVFTGTVTTGGLQKGTARWQDAVTVADRILNSGQYRLLDNWFDNFGPNNSGIDEHILVAPFLPVAGLGLNFIHRALHYNQFSPSPWNGFATLAETYHAFDDNDRRREIFLVGQAYNVETGEPVNDREGNPLIFTPDITDETNASEGEGVRILKFPHDPNHEGPDNGNDYPFFRLAEMYLIKAEALNELNGPNAESIRLLNELRERVYDPADFVALQVGDFSSKEALRDRIMQERMFELTYEAKRRQDLIRAGKFTQAWSFKAASEPFRILFPVPQTQLDANPQLTQNPGY